MLAAQVVYHPQLHLHPCLVHEVDLLVFALTWQRLHVSFTRLGCWLIRKTRQVQHNMSYCGVLSLRGIQATSWTCIFVSFWIQFNSHTQVFHLRERENKMCTSHVSSTSPLVENGAVVGKWIIQRSLQVSVSELANTKDS